MTHEYESSPKRKRHEASEEVSWWELIKGGLGLVFLFTSLIAFINLVALTPEMSRIEEYMLIVISGYIAGRWLLGKD